MDVLHHVRYYQAEDGSVPFSEWLHALTETRDIARAHHYWTDYFWRMK